jgi:hypothetical protein
MNEVKRYTLEGFEDFRGEYDTGIYLCKPVVDCIDGSTIANVVEDFCIDASVGDEWEGDGYLNKRGVLNCFYKVRKKKRTPNFRYFRAVVDVYLDDDHKTYDIIEKEGF